MFEFWAAATRKREDVMSRRTIAICTLVTLVLVSGMIGAYFFLMHYIEEQRIREAAAAFQPVEKLDCLILSNPVAFERCCCYILEFPPTSKLADSNIATLRSLNRLPSTNRLEVIIRTRKVTDNSLPVLKSITVFDALDVRETLISDEGIEELQRAFPDAYVLKRDRKKK